MKILLIYPYWLEKRTRTEDVTVPPIGIYYIGAVLKENHYDVEILNWCSINETPQEIERVLGEKKPDVIGFSILQANRWGGIDIARIAKRIDPGVKIVFGGVAPTGAFFDPFFGNRFCGYRRGRIYVFKSRQMDPKR
ncbi:MAG: cobalamin B12-binding domain-containing protein [Deltaproteobacteria bacterium]|nr:cobalamin B12-binding domain-containing protein [Deltaproteobacteria bacterium]